MPCSWVNTECSIHQVLHHSMMDCLPLPASFSYLGGCTQLCAFQQLRTNQSIECQLPSCLPPDLPPPSTPSISIGHGLLVYLPTHSITASKCISEFTRSQPANASPNLLEHSLQVHLWVPSNSDSKCISTFPRSRPPNASLSSRDLGLQLHLQTQSILASKCISEFTWSQSPSASQNMLDHSLQIYLSGVTAGGRRYSGNGGGQSDREYIFGRPQSR